MDYIYFENVEHHLLEHNNTEYSPVNAWWFAECSFLAYCHPGFARMAYKLAGFDGFQFLGDTGTECMVSWNSRVVIAAFRGTEMKSFSTLHEIRTDLKTAPVSFETGGKVHKGFLNGLDEIWEGPEGLKVLLEGLIAEKTDRPLFITGHSLGGALASLCFARIPQAKGLYTYGAPRVGDKEFVNLFEGRSVWRIENVRDPVPLVPLDIPSLGFNFADLGTLKFLDPDGRVLDKRPHFVLKDQKSKYLESKAPLDAKIKEMGSSLAPDKEGFKGFKHALREIGKHIRFTKKEWKTHTQNLHKEFGLSVNDHQPIFYVTKIWNALDDS
ncbi:MAG: lipase family protein [Spirochaetota bacterium]|nr:lipase family protein [Spirochaetota bacterium]